MQLDSSLPLLGRRSPRTDRPPNLCTAAAACTTAFVRVQEATDIYKKLLLECRDNIALNVYVAMCYYKLDYYDVSMEILAVYLQAHPSSAVAINLKACNLFR
jgi:hypothetical protein